MTKNEKGKKILDEILEDITSSRLPLSSILKKYITVTQLLNMTDKYEEIMKELNGYKASDILPIYRTINCNKRYSWLEALPAFIFNNPELKNEFYKQKFQDYQLLDSVSKLEIYQGKGMIYNIGAKKLVNFEYDELIDVRQEQISEILQTIQNNLFIDCSTLSINLEFSNKVNSIYQEREELVNNALVKVSPETLKELGIATNTIQDGEEPLKWSQASLACLEALVTFANDVYKETYLPEGEKRPAHTDFKRKIKFTLLANFNDKIKPTYLEKLIEYLTSLDDFLQSVKHRPDLASKSHARRAVLYTYLVIGDLMESLS